MSRDNENNWADPGPRKTRKYKEILGTLESLKLPHPLMAMIFNQPDIGTDLLTKLYEDWTNYNHPETICWTDGPTDMGHTTVTCRPYKSLDVFLRKSATSPGSHDFQPTITIFKNFHEDWTINVASRVLTR
ncbi:hypothetical protein DPMN_074100 [Dreissena polymorpha]|uniref:Uncharacterized protein n=1 Tax=Dreissena polymorpha TaxID=45954 RepID=A0A9D3YIJ7_DREPO|nr:hypothetical protein DPMN_074100 [Dreissena polymorpha]